MNYFKWHKATGLRLHLTGSRERTQGSRNSIGRSPWILLNARVVFLSSVSWTQQDSAQRLPFSLVVNPKVRKVWTAKFGSLHQGSESRAYLNPHAWSDILIPDLSLVPHMLFFEWEIVFFSIFGRWQNFSFRTFMYMFLTRMFGSSAYLCSFLSEPSG